MRAGVRSLCAVVAGAPRHDVVHINSCHSLRGLWFDVAAASAARALGASVVVHYHGDVPSMQRDLGRGARTALRALARVGHQHIAMTPASAAALERLAGPRKVTTLPNVVDPGWIERPPARGEADGQLVEIVCVGRVSREKGALDLLAVAPTLHRVRVTLVGEADDDTAPELAQMPDNVSWLGPRPHDEVIDILRAADIAVCPSYREGFPYAVLEALAAGLPIVGTDVGGVAQMVVHGQGGFVFAPGDLQALGSFLELLVSDVGLRRRMGAYNRRRCGELYDADRVLPALRDVWRRSGRRQYA